MNQTRACGCKGIRTCLICEKEYNLKPNSILSADKARSYVYCYACRKAWEGWDGPIEKDCPNHSGESLSVNGIFVQPEFITAEEKEKLLQGINNETWDLSQSGRRKQNYGPKCNFKRKKIQIGNFNGFPMYSKLVHNKFKTLSILKNFNVIEQCTLEYNPNRGASIDPHIDDCWIWGERIVTLNILGDTFLSMSKYKGNNQKYNLDEVDSYPCILNEDGNFVNKVNSKPFQFGNGCNDEIENEDVILRIFMPEKSLIILYGSARYEWEHYVLRQDIKNLRICLAYREFTPPYLPGGSKENIANGIWNMSNRYW